MTKIKDLIGDFVDKFAQDNIKKGDVHMLVLDKNNGITPKDGKETRNKFSSLYWALIKMGMLSVVW